MKLCPIPSDGLQSPTMKVEDLLPAGGVFKIVLKLLVSCCHGALAEGGGRKHLEMMLTQ